jgi:hypothetical protein
MKIAESEDPNRKHMVEKAALKNLPFISSRTKDM